MSKPINLVFCLFLLSIQMLYSQEERTLGTLDYLPGETSPGYTLLAPNSNDVYLIDECGKYVHKWETECRPGQMTYLMPDGKLLRTCNEGQFFNGGGRGGALSLYDWDGNLEWYYQLYQDTLYHQHHDVAILPNGNILAILWEYISPIEAAELGRVSQSITDQGLWLEMLYEVKPIGSNEAEIVWEWHLKDHVIQDWNDLLPNYAIIEENPHKHNLNYFRNGNHQLSPDYIHFNSIDYNPELDQILLSSRALSEIWILDHSTSTGEAATSSGGNSGMGGSILYRYGNPAAYNQGTVSDRVLYAQHDANWVPDDRPFGGKISIYNNGDGRPIDFPNETPYSTVEILSPEVNNDGSYTITDGAFGPDSFDYSFGEELEERFYSPRTSGVEILPNGNLLICAGQIGLLLEYNSEEELVWRYQNPINTMGVLSQGSTPFNAGVFKVRRYPVDYTGIVGELIASPTTIEEGTPLEACIGVSTEDDLIDVPLINTLWRSDLVVTTQNHDMLNLEVYDMLGHRVMKENFDFSNSIDVSNLNPGSYIVKLSYESDNKVQSWTTYKCVKL